MSSPPPLRRSDFFWPPGPGRSYWSFFFFRTRSDLLFLFLPQKVDTVGRFPPQGQWEHRGYVPRENWLPPFPTTDSKKEMIGPQGVPPFRTFLVFSRDRFLFPWTQCSLLAVQGPKVFSPSPIRPPTGLNFFSFFHRGQPATLFSPFPPGSLG